MFIQIRKCFWPLMLLQVRRGCTGNHPDVTKTSGYKTRILKRTQADKAIYAFRDQISFFIRRNQHNFNTWIQCLKMPKIRDQYGMRQRQRHIKSQASSRWKSR